MKRIHGGTVYNIGDIVIVRFPFTDSASSKQRPVIIIHVIYDYNDYLCMPITSKIKDEKNRIGISNNDINPDTGILQKKSQAIIDKLYTFNDEIIKKKFASIKKEKYLEIINILIKCLQNDIKIYSVN